MSLPRAEFGRLFQALRSEGGEVGRRSQGEQALVGADVARRLLPADVLLARLERQDEAALALAIDRLADQPARHLADERLLDVRPGASAGQDSQVGPAEGHRVAEALPLGDGDVRPVVARTLQQADADRVEADDEQGSLLAGDPGQLLDLLQAA